MSYYIHPLSDVQTSAIGKNTTIWQFCVILENVRIGTDCNICAYVFIEKNVNIGNCVTIKSGVQLWEGVDVEDYVFIGPNVTFTNDRIPRSKNEEWRLSQTLLKKGCSIGANSTLVAGIKIGEYALIGAGSVVTKNIPANTLWYGNPATQKGFVTNEGIILDMDKRDKEGKLHAI